MYISWEPPRKNEKLAKRYVRILVQIPPQLNQKQGWGVKIQEMRKSVKVQFVIQALMMSSIDKF